MMKKILLGVLCLIITHQSLMSIPNPVFASVSNNRIGTSDMNLDDHGDSNQLYLHLKFDFACRQNVALNSCTGNVRWNDQIIYQMNPRNYEINTIQLAVYADDGRNSLSFESTGVSDSFGVLIDNVQLIRSDTQEDIVINGGFENPNVNGGWNIFQNILGWKGKAIQIGQGGIYNRRLNSQVCELDSNGNMQMTQYFDITFQQQELDLLLSFDFACRQNVALNSCTGNVKWNDQVIYQITPTNYEINNIELMILANTGNNRLSFESTGVSDSLGVLIDNVQLIRSDTQEDLIINGGFENPNVKGGWNIFQNIQGWKGKAIQIGQGGIYNKRLNSQVCELDSNANSLMSQDFQISFRQQGLPLLLLFDFACRQNVALNSCTGNVKWNDRIVYQMSPVDYEINKAHMIVRGEMGQNSLSFESTGVSDSLGLLIDNVQLIRSDIHRDIVINGCFENPNVNGGWNIFQNIQGWTGKAIQIGQGGIYNRRFNSQVCELDSNGNSILKQDFQLNFQ